LEYGAFALAFGSSRGGRTSKLHGLTDDQGRPRVLLISAGDINGMTMVGSLIDATGGRFDRLIADKGYDTNAIRAAVTALGAELVIPSTFSRRAPSLTVKGPIARATWSSASGAGSRTGVASSRATTRLPSITSPTPSLPQLSSSGVI
jgi:transposase